MRRQLSAWHGRAPGGLALTVLARLPAVPGSAATASWAPGCLAVLVVLACAWWHAARPRGSQGLAGGLSPWVRERSGPWCAMMEGMTAQLADDFDADDPVEILRVCRAGSMGNS
jgi:hypothetical protein